MSYAVKSVRTILDTEAKLGILLIIIMIGLGLALFLIPANAETKLIHIGLSLSESCNSLIESGDVETCSSYPYLNSLYPETIPKESYQRLIQEAEQTEKTQYQINNILLNHQIQCISKDYCNIFETKSKVLFWFNPDTKVRPYLDVLIEIHPTLKHTNIDKTLQPITTNSTHRQLDLEINRLYVHPSCRIADYTPEILYREMGGIIYYMLNNCHNDNHLGILKPNYSQQLSKHIADLSTSPNIQAQIKLKADIERCKLKC